MEIIDHQYVVLMRSAQLNQLSAFYEQFLLFLRQKYKECEKKSESTHNGTILKTMYIIQRRISQFEDALRAVNVYKTILTAV